MWVRFLPGAPKAKNSAQALFFVCGADRKKRRYTTLTMKRVLAKLFLAFLGAWLLIWNSFLTLAVMGDTVGLAIVRMSWGLILVWIFLGGVVMYRSREQVRAYVRNIPLPWQVTFVLFATALALLEEAVTVSLTNLAPLFGAPVGNAYITASANYIDVVLFHSVVVFIPFFVAWAVLLSKYNFTPFSVFLLFGITGILAEVSFGGPIQLLGFAQWIFVYGLMAYLPAYSLPKRAGLRIVRWHHHLLAIPATFLIALPLLLPLVFFISTILNHPSIHFAH